MTTESEKSLPSQGHHHKNIFPSLDPNNNVSIKTKENTSANKVDEVANNDGSIIETLDTAFHGEPGMIKDHSLAGSNRADYYESRSGGQSDSEEELNALKKQQPE